MAKLTSCAQKSMKPDGLALSWSALGTLCARSCSFCRQTSSFPRRPSYNLVVQRRDRYGQHTDRKAHHGLIKWQDRDANLFMPFAIIARRRTNRRMILTTRNDMATYRCPVIFHRVTYAAVPSFCASSETYMAVYPDNESVMAFRRHA